MENTFVSINQEIGSSKQAKISVFDRGFLYGDSIYEVSYTQDRCILFFDEHLDRLYRSAELIGLPITYSRETIKSEVLRLLKHSGLNDAYFRIIITRGSGELSMNPLETMSNNLVIVVKARPSYPQYLYEQGIDLLLSSFMRNPKEATDPNAKSGNYLNNVLALGEARKKNISDAIMVNKEGEITEGTTFNIWLVKDGVAITPYDDSGLLKGITRQKILELKSTPCQIEMRKILEDELHLADEAFITSSTRGVMPVQKIHTAKGIKEFADFPITNAIRASYTDLVNQHLQSKKYTY